MIEIPEQLMVEIEQLRRLDKNRNKTGTPATTYRDISVMIADHSIEVIEELIKLVKAY